MSTPRFITPKQRRAYAAKIREALAANPKMTLADLVTLTGASTGIVQHIAARVRRETAHEGS